MATVRCVKCGSPMVKRNGKRGPFYGCSAYPRCSSFLSVGQYNQAAGITKEIKPYVRKERNWSDKQLAIFDLIINSVVSIIIQAVAGSGKSTTIAEAASRLIEKNPELSIVYCTFSKKSVNDMEGNIDPRVQVRTLHSIAYGKNVAPFLASNRIPKKDPDDGRYNKIFKKWLENNYLGDKDLMKVNEPVVVKIVSLLKAMMLDTSKESVDFVCNKHAIILSGDTDSALQAVEHVFNTSLDYSSGDLSFDDMIYWIASGIIPVREQYDVIFVDEAQDTDPAQMSMLKKILKPNGRLIAVGDRKQSIYGFRAADTEAMDKIKNMFGCVELPLDISYRCPKVSQADIQTRFPGIQFFSGSSIQGEFKSVFGMDQFMAELKDDDLILCRNNAPLVKPCYELIKQGKKAVILGRDFTKELITFANRVINKYGLTDASVMVEMLESYANEEAEKFIQQGQPKKVEALMDKVDTLKQLAEGIDWIEDLWDKMDEIFSDEKGAITFCTIHKAKGAEAEDVFILNPGLIGKNAKQQWEIEQEQNLLYVARTRHKNTLTEAYLS